MDAPASLEKVRKACDKRGASGVKGLGRAFRIYDDDHNRTLNFDEFKKGLKDYGAELDDEEMKELFLYFNKNDENDVAINIDEFIHAFRKPLNPSRLKVVEMAFNKADRTGDKVITIKDLKGVYNAREHPKYKNGEMTEKDVFLEFLKNFESDDCPDGKVTWEEFQEYYCGVGAGIDSDAYFDLMRNQMRRGKWFEDDLLTVNNQNNSCTHIQLTNFTIKEW